MGSRKLYRQSRDGKIVLVGAPSRSEGKINRSIYVLGSGEIFKRIDKPLQEAVFLRTLAPYLITRVEVNYCFADDLTDESFVRALKADGVGLVCALDFGLFDSGDCAKRRESMIVNCAREGIAFAVANQVSQDDVIYEGRSFVVNCKGRETVRLKAFETDEGAVTVSNLFEDKTKALVREPGRYETLLPHWFVPCATTPEKRFFRCLIGAFRGRQRPGGSHCRRSARQRTRSRRDDAHALHLGLELEVG